MLVIGVYHFVFAPNGTLSSVLEKAGLRFLGITGVLSSSGAKKGSFFLASKLSFGESSPSKAWAVSKSFGGPPKALPNVAEARSRSWPQKGPPLFCHGSAVANLPKIFFPPTGRADACS